MRVTIVPGDNLVVIDGVGASVDCSELPLFFHAIHWDGLRGEIELKPDERGIRHGNIRIASIEPWEFLIDRWRLILSANKVAEKKQAAEHHERQVEHERMLQQTFNESKEFVAKLNEERAQHQAAVEELQAKHDALEQRISDSIARLEELVAARPKGMDNAPE